MPSPAGARAPARQSEDADPGGDVRGFLSRAVRPLPREISATGGRAADLHAARRHRHQGQQPRDDEREEQQGDRGRHRAMAWQDASGEGLNYRRSYHLAAPAYERRKQKGHYQVMILVWLCTPGYFWHT